MGKAHDGARRSRQIPELAGAEAEPVVVGMPARVTIGERGKEQRAGMRRHVQAVGNER